MKFATKLKKLIEARGWNKSHVAKGMRVSGSTLTRWTREDPGKGKKSPTKPKLEQLLLLSRLFDVPMEYLADDAMDEPPAGLNWQERAILAFSRSMGLQAAMDRLARQGDAPPAVLPVTPAQGFLDHDGNSIPPPAPPRRGAGKPPRSNNL